MLKNTLNNNNYNELKRDINTYLYKDYDKKMEIRSFLQKNSNRQPYYKNIFDNYLKDKADYILYKEFVISDEKYTELIDSAFEIFGYNYIDYIYAQTITMSYIGFCIELIAKNTINNYGFYTKDNKYLDNNRKIDLLVNDSIPIQIKNITFLDEYSENRIDYYKRINNDLYFLFWQLDKSGNISFVKVDNKLLTPISILNGFSFPTAEKVQPIDFYNELKKLTERESIA